MPILVTKIELWNPERLIPLERNPRTHSDQQIDGIAASMRAFGFLWPIMVNGETREIVAGNGRYLAALKQEPWREAPLGLVSSGSGGAVAVWDDGRDASHYALYARGIASLGSSVWPVGGSAVMSSATAGLDADFAAVGDGAGGVFAAYGINNPTTSWDVYLNRIGPGPLTGVIPSLPSGLLSFSAAPNPFNGSLHLVVTTPVGGPLAADLLDVEGRVVARIANETVEAGTISLDWQVPGPRSIKPGVYYARVRVGRVMRFERLVEGG